MPIFNFPISYGSPMAMKPRVLAAKFGDGYEQRTLDGINNKLETWQIQARGLKDATEAATMEAFLRTQAGVTPFTWVTPYGRTALFVCKDWARTPVYSGISNITAKFDEVPA